MKMQNTIKNLSQRPAHVCGLMSVWQGRCYGFGFVGEIF